MTHTHLADATELGAADMTTDKQALLKMFRARLLRARQAKNWSQVDLARAAGLGKDIVSQYSNGKAMPREDSVLKLANALGVKPSDLVPTMDENFGGVDPDVRSSAFEMRVLPGNPSRAMLRADTVTSTKLAIQIIRMLQDEAEAEEVRGGTDLAS